jgi:hypothetical protein
MTEMAFFTFGPNRAIDDRHDSNTMELFSREQRPGLGVAPPRSEQRFFFERYRLAVHAFTQAVDCLNDDLSGEFHARWERAEAARQRVDSVCAELLLHDHEPNRGPRTDQRTEELVLGDQGQSGG